MSDSPGRFQRNMPKPSNEAPAGFIPMQSSGKTEPGFYDPITGQTKYKPGVLTKDRSGDAGRRRPKKTAMAAAGGSVRSGGPHKVAAQGQAEVKPHPRRVPKPGHRRNTDLLEQSPWVEIDGSTFHQVKLGPHTLWVEHHLGHLGHRALSSEEMLDLFHTADANPVDAATELHHQQTYGEPFAKAEDPEDPEKGDTVEDVLSSDTALFFRTKIDGLEGWIETLADGRPTGRTFTTRQVRMLVAGPPPPPEQATPSMEVPDAP